MPVTLLLEVYEALRKGLARRMPAWERHYLKTN